MKPRKKHISKKIPSQTNRLHEVRDFVGSVACSYGFSTEEIANIVLAVDEACTNIIKHAYQYDTNKEIEILIYQDSNSFEIRIFDNGRAFDPTTLRTPDLKEHIGHRHRGGLGVHLMKRLMDKVEYSFNPGERNEVRLTKFRSNVSATAGS